MALMVVAAKPCAANSSDAARRIACRPRGGQRRPSCLRGHRLGTRPCAAFQGTVGTGRAFPSARPGTGLDADARERQNSGLSDRRGRRAGRDVASQCRSDLTEVGTAEVAPGHYFSSLAEPVGVVAIIVPWNAPVALFIRSLGPALAAGNTVAAKLPGQTGLTNALVADIVSQARSLPAGVVNMFTESGNTGAPFLIQSADVDMVSFTGSIPVGRQIAAAVAKTLKRINLELGGKTPMVVFDDASLAATLPLLTAGVITFAGQFCMAGSRILVQRGIADQVREHFAERLSHVLVGRGEDKDSQMGPPSTTPPWRASIGSSRTPPATPR